MTCDSTTRHSSEVGACRLLIVDDDQDTVNFLTVALRGLGHDIETTRNGTEALTVATTFQPHIVLIDIGLPGLDGYHVTRELRKTIDSILVIAITGRHAPDDFKRSQEAGCDHHLVKPIHLEQLIRLLGRWKDRGGCESAPDAA
jgi:two-component system, sensor histidine kinase